MMQWLKLREKRAGIIKESASWLLKEVKLAWGQTRGTLNATELDVLSKKMSGISPATKWSIIKFGLRMGVVTIARTSVSVLFLLMLLMAVVLEIAKPKASVKPSEREIRYVRKPAINTKVEGADADGLEIDLEEHDPR